MATLDTSGFRTPRLNLRRPRSYDSVVTEREAMEAGIQIPPYVRWPTFLSDYFTWRQGEHLTLVGGTGSGKTTLARQVLPRRDYVVVLATKAKDTSLYDPLVREGYVVTDRFEPDHRDTPRVIYKPPLASPTKAALADQAEAFRTALVAIFQEGGWCIFCDEIRYLTETLKLRAEIELLYLQGRSLGVTMVAATQRPVSIPIVAFQAPHLFSWGYKEKGDIDRIGEFTGELKPTIQTTLPRLPKHEVLYIAQDAGQLLRTKVSR